jgi:hypothetical protein
VAMRRPPFLFETKRYFYLFLVMQQIRNAKTTNVTNYLYVTANQVKSIADASVRYLVELTSQSSLQSLYFIAVTESTNDRYLKLKFFILPSEGSPDATAGQTMFWDSTGKFDSYPMGFYTYKIYEQTSTTNLNPTNATQLEEGIAYVRAYDGNMEELSDDFKAYTTEPTQFVYQS